MIISEALIKENDIESVIGVVSHELGHVVLNHNIVKGLITCGEAVLVVGLFSIVYKERQLIQSFGFKAETNFVYLFLFLSFYTPINFIVSILMNYMSRKMEMEADEYALKRGKAEGLKKALI